MGEICLAASQTLVAQPVAYRAEAKIGYNAGDRNPVLKLLDPENESSYVSMYSGGSSQVAWLANAFAGQTVTVDFMLVMPNKKSYYRCIPFSATNGTTTVYNDIYLKTAK